jgi:hypothetical protein
MPYPYPSFNYYYPQMNAYPNMPGMNPMMNQPHETNQYGYDVKGHNKRYIQFNR